MRENNLLSPHRCRRRGGNPHDGSSLMPRTSCGAPMAFVHGGRRLGLDLHRRRALERRAGMSASAATASPPSADLHGACRAVWLDDHGSQYRPLHQVLGSSYRRRAPDQRRRRAESHAEGTDHPWSYRNIADLRDAVRDFELYNAQWIVEKNGYLSPAQARQAWHAAISIRPAAYLCVAGGTAEVTIVCSLLAI